MSPDKKPWKPKRILNELWGFWVEELQLDEKLRNSTDRIDFHEKYVRTISRLRGRTTKEYIHDSELFFLIEKFVETHADPEHWTPASQEVKSLKHAATSISEFLDPYPKFEEPRGNRQIGTDQVKHLCPMEKLLQDSPSLEQVSLMRLTDNGDGDVYECSNILSSKYLAIKFNFADSSTEKDRRQKYWPAILFDEKLAYLELGFYVRTHGMVCCRSVIGSTAGKFKRGLTKESKYSLNKTARLLDIRSTITDEIIVNLSFNHLFILEKSTLPEYDHIAPNAAYSIESTFGADLHRFAIKMLNLLD